MPQDNLLQNKKKKLDKPALPDFMARITNEATESNYHENVLLLQLAESNHFITSVLNSVKSLVLVLDRSGNVVWVNRPFEELTGYSAKELIIQGIWQTVVPPEKVNSVRQYFKNTLLGKIPEKDELNLVTKSGERKLTSWSLSVLKDELGDTSYIIATGTDITEARQMAQALLNSERRFRQLAENARDIIYRQRLLPEPYYEYMSAVTYTVTGYRPEEFYANAYLDLQCILPEDRDKVKLVYEGCFKEQEAYRWRHKNGQIIWLEVLRTPVYDQQGRLVAIEGVARDITDRKKLEQKLRYLSMHDALTGLYNRAYFEEEMQRLGNGRSNPVGLIIIDMDGLKKVNDSLGHATGDKLIQYAAQIIGSCFRKNDVVARIGGDEFAILLGETCQETLVEAVRRIKQSVKDHNLHHRLRHQTEPTIGLSIGWAIRLNQEKTMTDLFREADRQMYAHKPYHCEKPEKL